MAFQSQDHWSKVYAVTDKILQGISSSAPVFVISESGLLSILGQR
jgi:hypothetical protein